MTDSLRLSIVQATIAWEDREENLRHYGELLQSLSGQTDVAVLPETFTTGFTMNVEDQGDHMDGITVATVKQWASQFSMAIAGSFIAQEAGLYYNRAFFITPGGEAYFYDKRHLFRMGGENQHFTAGNKQLIINFLGWNICLMVCYDLRFPVWSRNVNNGYDLLIYCANWPEVRKEVWKSLLLARSIENIAYVCGVNRVGTDGKGFAYVGDSLVFSPRGKKLADAGVRDEAVVTVTLSKTELMDFRTKFPAWQDADRFELVY